MVLDSIYNTKYQYFKHLFEDCCQDFSRDILTNSRFVYYTPKQEEDNEDEFQKMETYLPVIEEAFKPAKNLFLVLSGQVHIMDQAGMYDYGLIKGGSFFGDISLLLGKPNEYSFFYNPH